MVTETMALKAEVLPIFMRARRQEIRVERPMALTGRACLKPNWICFVRVQVVSQSSSLGL